MGRTPTFAQRVAQGLNGLGPAERQVARFFADNREEVMVASAAALAAEIGTSDATVVRTVKALGYAGMDELRRELAAELRASLAPASRLARTLGDAGDDLHSAFDMTLDIHMKALEDLRRDIGPALFRDAVLRFAGAQRVFIFGIGPSSAMAGYLAIQLGRFGIDAAALTQTGLLLADGLHRLRSGDLVVILAYGRLYAEVDVLLSHADHLGIAKILLTDAAGPALGRRVDIVLPVARGRTDRLSMHTATLGLIEALLVGIATQRAPQTIASLKRLNDLRARLAGQAMDLPLPRRRAGARHSRA